MKPIISVRGLGKKYRIRSEEKKRYSTLRDDLAETVQKILQGKLWRRHTEDFWALQDINFDIYPGEVVGIIGRNGAGKSTLLKILSRIVKPTLGEARLRGRVGSLLEVGAGFHPELTGRENIFMNGTVLGMKRAEIKKKFDEIVAFAEVEKFLDTPVKHYSSGMYVRLAFAVAAHLEPEILLVDEVLAVGDAAFQKKCLGKMEDVAAKEGRTVLFVSHNMGAISTLTSKSVFLNRGRLIFDGKTEDAVSKYISESYNNHSVWQAESPNDHPLQIVKVTLLNQSGQQASEFDVQEGLSVELEYEVRKALKSAVVAVNIHAADGTHLVSLEDTDREPDLLIERQPGRYSSSVKIPGDWLNSGSYLLRVSCGIPRRLSFDNIEALMFALVETGDCSTRGHRRGYLLPMLKWETQLIDFFNLTGSRGHGKF